jgi:benzoyl-CoA reductase subunit D
MTLSLGIDVGSSAIKVAVIDSPNQSGRARDGARLLSAVTERVRRRDQRLVIGRAFEGALEQAGVRATEIDYVATTGEGELVEFRTGHFYGMTAHARGALFLDPEARAAIDVGALHGRAIKFDERSKVLAYQMTSQCASGTGQFLENIARYLGVSLQEIGALSQQGDAPERVSGICAVLAETDVINMVSRGITTANILKGIHESMAQRFLKLLKSVRAEGVVLVTGGLASDTGLVACLRESAEKIGGLQIRTAEGSVFAGAIGAALWGAYRFERMRESEAA